MVCEAVLHERVRHVETEEVKRVLERDRHIHHVQHHIQPVIAREFLPEETREIVHPLTNVLEIHANKGEDTTFFDTQVHEHRDTLVHGEKERMILDKGVTVKEHVHHHVHHIIQPIIEKETIQRRSTSTVIPIHEVTHEAPVVHSSQTHDPVPIEHFLERGGRLRDAIGPDEVGSRVLHSGTCSREIDGVADTLAKELKLGDIVVCVF
ncbi:hypothetical protein P691DRAFT_671079 [Macrolepiota fuliginosa MF-IS2]|uniref:Allergen n=1 Tax=Macrolepiota fuliginosa MF-IS2 TaxID=1400762 RepID=A0A9P5XC82_9AGAR|nr:hypothetical protein P691DRAFT_671079 [Macrolepiota fuliginosa MF-IS2]